MITRAAAIVTACVTVGGGAWYAGDYTGVRPVLKKEYIEAEALSADVLQGLVTQQQQLTSSIVELQFQSLDQRKQRGELDFQDRQTYCRLAKKLEYVNVAGCDD
jgi:hypothetical protein